MHSIEDTPDYDISRGAFDGIVAPARATPIAPFVAFTLADKDDRTVAKYIALRLYNGGTFRPEEYGISAERSNPIVDRLAELKLLPTTQFKTRDALLNAVDAKWKDA